MASIIRHRLIRKTAFITAVICSLILCISDVQADQEDDSSDRRWAIFFGQSLSLSTLDEANRTIAALGDMAREYAPAIKELEDWDDVPRGVSTLGLNYKFPDVLNEGIDAYLELALGYAKGSVKTDDHKSSIIGTPTNFHHEMEYETNLLKLQSGLLKEIYRRRQRTVQIGISGSIQINSLKSSTHLILNDLGTGFQQTVMAESKDSGLGYAITGTLGYNHGRWVYELQGFYTWGKINGYAHVTEISTMSATQRYDQPYETSFTGPSIKLRIGFRF